MTLRATLERGGRADTASQRVKREWRCLVIHVEVLVSTVKLMRRPRWTLSQRGRAQNLPILPRRRALASSGRGMMAPTEAVPPNEAICCGLDRSGTSTLRPIMSRDNQREPPITLSTLGNVRGGNAKHPPTRFSIPLTLVGANRLGHGFQCLAIISSTQVLLPFLSLASTHSPSSRYLYSPHPGDFPGCAATMPVAAAIPASASSATDHLL